MQRIWILASITIYKYEPFLLDVEQDALIRGGTGLFRKKKLCWI
jgi:hypothetical protein